jgi:hypothetical protein
VQLWHQGLVPASIAWGVFVGNRDGVVSVTHPMSCLSLVCSTICSPTFPPCACLSAPHLPACQDYMAPEVLICPDKRRPEENKDKVLLAYTAQVGRSRGNRWSSAFERRSVAAATGLLSRHPASGGGV